jgi:hypothetical protein
MPTGFRGGVPKDVFVVHSKGDKTHAALVDLLGSTLASFGRSPWEYSDWDWEATRKGAIRYDWSGRADQLDSVRYMTGEAPFRRRKTFTEIDKESLDQLLQTSRVLVLLAPTSGQLSAGSLVEVERIAALTGRRESSQGAPHRPLIIEAGWMGEPLPDFTALAPALHLTLSNDKPHDAARLAAAFVSAWVVHTLQTSYGVPGQHLLSRAASGDQILDQLVTRSPNHRTLDFAALEERSRPRAREWSENRPIPEVRMEERGPGMVSMPNSDDMEEMVRRMINKMAPVMGSKRFSRWLDRQVAPIRDWVDAQANSGEEIAAARSLLRCMTENWRDSFERLEWAETLLDRERRD